MSALHLAAKNGNIEIAELLLSHGAKIDIVSEVFFASETIFVGILFFAPFSTSFFFRKIVLLFFLLVNRAIKR